MTFSIYTPETYTAMPWRNGKGQTIELLKEEIVGDEGFAWRLSKAEVSEDGEFSEFTEYARTLILLSGDGMTLEHQYSPTHILTQPLQIARFSGGEKTLATLHNGSITDFNIMTRKAYCNASITTSNDANEIALSNPYDVQLVYSVNSIISVETGSQEEFELPAEHLLLARHCNDRIDLSGGPCIAIGITYN